VGSDEGGLVIVVIITPVLIRCVVLADALVVDDDVVDDNWFTEALIVCYDHLQMLTIL
jgi:hypothetical protein